MAKHDSRAGRRRNRISGQFSPRLIEMLRCPAYRALSLSGHRVISRIEIELADHGGNNNGILPVTKQDFADYGISNDSIAPGIREAVALGFIRVKQGRAGNAEHRQSNLFRLTFAHDRNSRQEPPTDDWRKIKTLDEALAIARTARAAKDQLAVSRGARSAALRNRNQSGKPGPAPVRDFRTENAKSPVRENRTTGPVQKTGLLSISPCRAGGRAAAGGGVSSASARQRIRPRPLTHRV
jgi:hypothetical protein